MLIYGYKGDKCLKSDNFDDGSIKNLIAIKNYNIDLYNLELASLKVQGQ